jgi:prolyl oligopeptidase
MQTLTQCYMFAALLYAAQAVAAPAPKHPVSVTFGNDTFLDSYDWMEAQGPEYLAWVHAQNAITRQTLTGTPGYAPLAAQVAAASDADTQITNVQPVADQIYYEKQGHGDAQPSLYSRAAAGGPERRLVDPVSLGDTTTSIHEYAVSPDNRRLAICLSKGGSEDAVLRVMDIGSGNMLPEHIDRAGAAGPTWSQDGSVLFYNRLKVSFSSPSDRFSDETVFRHQPGDDPSHDFPVFTAVAAGSELGRAAFIGIVVIPGSEYALAFANTGVSKEAEWFVTPIASLFGNSPHWQHGRVLPTRSC